MGKLGLLPPVIMIIAVVAPLMLNVHLYAVNQPNDEYSKSKQMEFQTIEKGYFSMHKSPAYYVIQTEDEWISIWNHHDISIPQRSPPEIDFSKSTVIAVFMGEFNTGGYGIEIKNILDMNHSVLIKIEKTYPGKKCCVIEAFTYPYHIVKTDKIDKEITFDTAERTVECP